MNKYFWIMIFFFGLSLILVPDVIAQNDPLPCGYEIDRKYLRKIKKPSYKRSKRLKFVNKFSIEELYRIRKIKKPWLGKFKIAEPDWPDDSAQIPSLEVQKRIVPIVAQIVRQSNQVGGLTETQLNNAIATANGFYSKFNFELLLCGIRYIDNDNIFNTSFSSSADNFGTSQASYNILDVQNRNVNRRLNIYFVPNSNTSWTWRPNSNANAQHILVLNSHASNGTTFSHEIGHWFDLFHTHNGGDELVNGTNCRTAGDLICDTPADPGLSGRVDGNCGYSGGSNIVDANGDRYNPDTRNLLSYAGTCRNRFSIGQQITMLSSFLGMQQDRGYTFDCCGGSSSLSDTIDLTEYIKVGHATDACNNSNPLYFYRKGETVFVAPTDRRIFDFGHSLTEINWFCCQGNARVASNNRFSVVEVNRRLNGTIDWVFFRKRYPCTPSDNIDLGKYEIVGTSKVTCDPIDPVYFNKMGGMVTLMPNCKGLYELGRNSTELIWKCGNSDDVAKNRTAFTVVRAERSATGAISWTFYRRRISCTPSDAIDINQYEIVGNATHACDQLDPVYFNKSGGLVTLMPNCTGLYELGRNTTELIWKCGNSDDVIKNRTSFTVVRAERSATGTISWTFYRRRISCTPSDAIDINQYEIVGNATHACDQLDPVYFNKSGGMVTLMPNCKGLYELGRNTTELIWKCGNSDDVIKNRTSFTVVRAERSATGTISWTFYRRRISCTPSDAIDINQYEIVGSATVACDQLDPVYFNKSGGMVTLMPNCKGLYELGRNTTELIWKCGNSDDVAKSERAFTVVGVSRNSTGTISWTFYRHRINCTPSDQIDLTQYEMVGQTSDVCDAVDPVYFSKMGGMVTLMPNCTGLYELGRNTTELIWKCGNSDDVVTHNTEFNIVRIQRSNKGVISWTFYRKK